MKPFTTWLPVRASSSTWGPGFTRGCLEDAYAPGEDAHVPKVAGNDQPVACEDGDEACGCDLAPDLRPVGGEVRGEGDGEPIGDPLGANLAQQESQEHHGREL